MTFPDGWTMSNGKEAVVAVSPQQDAMVEVAPAQQPSADAAARAFLSQQGITAGYPVRTSVGGLPALTAGFAAATDNGSRRGTAECGEHGGAVYRLLGHAVDARRSGYQNTADRAPHRSPRRAHPAA